ncbi:CAAX prenyl protease-like protein [Hydrogenoanaerobacterium saccharovorans]|uniref:CAAX protease self-immunity n=2 Tax=Hydrogenoanaerobacterium saccharovorans TaxID=474960 RepID=A0A1H8CFX1_9FIRM|nr:CAAX prenyl protease-like protein [Hydrogenoanaerobacterium saccharovorans]SEM93983.1 CAAX protease self-immunity [Hydrogenoanaerobacterium saccharovorans]
MYEILRHEINSIKRVYSYMEETDKQIAQKTMKKAFSRIGWAMTALIAVTYATQFGLSRLMKYYIPQFLNNEVFWWILATIPLYIFGLGVLLLAVRGMPAAKMTEGKDLTAPQIGALTCITLALSVAGGIATLILNGILGLIKGSPVADPSSTIENMSIIPTFLVVGIIAPVVEEYIFRGILIDKLRAYGEAICVFASAFLFSLLHGNSYQLISTFIIGAVLAYVTVKTNTIVYAILIHMSNNILAIIAARITTTQNVFGAAVFSVFTMALIIAGFVFFGLSIKRISLDNGRNSISVWERLRVFILSPGVMVYTIINLLLIVFSIFFVS